MRSPSKLHGAGLTLGITLFLAACDIGEARSEAGSNDNAATAAALSADDLPKCAAVAAVVGAPIAGMALMPSDEPAVWDDGDRFGLTCSWGNDESIRAAAGEVLGPQEIARIGAISLQIVVSDGGLAKAEAESVGMALADKRADAIGAWIMANHELDLGASLTAVAPQVIVGDISVAFASSGAWMNTPENLSSITNDWAIASAIKVHQMLKRPPGG